MTNKKPKRSNQSNAISRSDDEGGGDRSVRKHSSGIEQPVKGAVDPTHTEDCQSNFGRPGKGPIGSSGWRPDGTANARDKANVRQTGIETAMMPDVLLRLPLENLRMYGERKE